MGRFGLVLTDVVMPVMGGPQMIEALRAEGHNPCVLFASGYVDRDARAMRSWPESANLIPKPFAVHDLLKRVRIALDGR